MHCSPACCGKNACIWRYKKGWNESGWFHKKSLGVEREVNILILTHYYTFCLQLGMYIDFYSKISSYWSLAVLGRYLIMESLFEACVTTIRFMEITPIAVLKSHKLQWAVCCLFQFWPSNCGVPIGPPNLWHFYYPDKFNGNCLILMFIFYHHWDGNYSLRGKQNSKIKLLLFYFIFFNLSSYFTKFI